MHLIMGHHAPDETHSEIHRLYRQQYSYYADHTSFTKTNIALVNKSIYL